MEEKLFDIDFEKYPAFPYQNYNNRLVIAKALMLFSIVSCKHCYLINHTAEFIQVANEHSNENYTGKVDVFLENHLYDNMRIATAFDNYAKAILLCKGFAIHLIQRKKPYSDLYDEQRKRPVKISELTALENFQTTDKNGFMSLPGIQNNTLSLSNMLEEEYVKELMLPKELVDVLKEIIEERNKVHLYILSDIYFDMVINQLKAVNTAVTTLFPNLLKQ